MAHTEIDLANPKANAKNHGFTPEERAGFSAMIQAGFIDTFREFEKAGGHYTWWSPMSGARERNVGWRIDYFLISATLRPQIKRAFIRSAVMGSDHCPVGIELNILPPVRNPSSPSYRVPRRPDQSASVRSRNPSRKPPPAPNPGIAPPGAQLRPPF